MKIVATTSLPAVDRPNADRWNAARSRQKNLFKKHWQDCPKIKGYTFPYPVGGAALQAVRE